jgi:hypothetical protein
MQRGIGQLNIFACGWFIRQQQLRGIARISILALQDIIIALQQGEIWMGMSFAQ